MKHFKHWLFTATGLCILSITNAQTPVPPTKKIAILPVKTSVYTNAATVDNLQQQLQKEIEIGIYGQEILYNSLVNDETTLLVAIQHWQTTDSLLKKAKVDFRKINFLDKTALCKYLQVDEILTGELKSISKRRIRLGTDPYTAPIQAALAYFDGKKILTINLYEGNSGDLIWQDEIHVGANKLITTEKGVEKQILKKFSKTFPYIKS